MTDTELRRDDDLALAVYLLPLVEGRKVLLIGAVDDKARKRIASVARHLEELSLEELQAEGDLPFRDGVFDVVLSTDASALPEPRAELVAEARRVLSREGVLAWSTPQSRGQKRRRGGGTPYAALERLCLEHFDHVASYRQAAVRAHAFERVDAEVSPAAVDVSLLSGQPLSALSHLTLASDGPLRADPHLWVQLSGRPDAASPAGPADDVVQKLEHELKQAAMREAQALRELERERGLREQAEHAVERLSHKLEAAEADFDDAVARVRFLESEIAEKEGIAERERQLRLKAEQLAEQTKAQARGIHTQVDAAQAERDAAKAEAEALAKECIDLEKQLVERGEHVQALERDIATHETTARDLIEELRRIEQQHTEAVEHDARVAELEAERDRAVQRALDAEVAHEAAQMRVDELRARIARLELQAGPPAAELEGTIQGLRARVAELEQRLVDRAHDATIAALRGERNGLRLRLEEAERALHALSARAPGSSVSEASLDAAREEAEAHAARVRELGAEIAQLREDHTDVVRDLEERLEESEDRARALERELDEADRFAETQAEDAERLERLEAELRDARQAIARLEDELRAARADVDATQVEASARVELAQRRENEARAERDQARTALEETRAILAQIRGNIEVTN
jgi:SAM-dependent methyltransferase